MPACTFLVPCAKTDCTDCHTRIQTYPIASAVQPNLAGEAQMPFDVVSHYSPIAPMIMPVFDDDEPLSCGVENPVYCEACQ